MAPIIKPLRYQVTFGLPEETPQVEQFDCLFVAIVRAVQLAAEGEAVLVEWRCDADWRQLVQF